MGTEEWIVIVVVVGLRLFLPFVIPYYPLPGVLACLVLDSIDQSIFQKFPGIPLDGYQSYDKALDIYYLSITYMSTMRNWTDRPAFLMGRFLFFYRLVGDLLFQITGLRWLLFVFPNTFEYFFIFYEGVRLRWNVKRMGMWTVIIATALIWIFIKLPQEWWIHIAQLDVTDTLKTVFFGVETTDSWATAISNRPWVLVAMIAAVALLLLAAWWIITRKAPPADHGIVLKAEPLPAECQGAERYRAVKATEKIFEWSLLEKFLLTGLVGEIFAQMLGIQGFRLFFVAGFIIINAFLSQLIARRGRVWRSIAGEMAGMGVVNFFIVAILEILERGFDFLSNPTAFGKTLFFVFLLTVLTVMFDHYRTVLRARGLIKRDVAAREAAGAQV